LISDSSKPVPERGAAARRGRAKAVAGEGARGNLRPLIEGAAAGLDDRR
jgi:hypothetical protein